MTDALVISPARGFVAEHAHYLDDAGFWQAQAARLGGPVVDLGCAAGRVAVPLAAAGHDVIAVDADPEMLAVLGERASQAGVASRIQLVAAPMQHAPLPPGVPLVICPMNTLQVLLEPDDRRAVFGAVSRALAPGGEFIFDLSVPDFDDIAAHIGVPLPMGTSIDPDTGDALVHTAEYRSVDPDTGTAEFTITVERPARTDHRHHRVHLYAPDEVPALAREAGLAAGSVHAGFAGEDFDPVESERQVWRLGREAAE